MEVGQGTNWGCSAKEKNILKLLLLFIIVGRDASVGMATGYRPHVRVQFPTRVRDFLFSTAFRPALGSTQPPIQWVWEAISPGVKQPGHESDHSPSSSAEVKNREAIPPHLYVEWCLIQQDFTLLLLLLLLLLFPPVLACNLSLTLCCDYP
jgi:hypothetical protein